MSTSNGEVRFIDWAYDQITDDMLTKPVKDLTDQEAWFLHAVLDSDRGDELTRRIDALKR